MILPYLFFGADSNVFINDFFAKRFMSIFLIPFYIYVLAFSFFSSSKISKYLIAYILLMFFICIVSIVNNSILNILTDLFIFNIPICFYLLVNKTDFNIKSFSKYFPILLLLGSIIAAFDVKLHLNDFFY